MIVCIIIDLGDQKGERHYRLFDLPMIPQLGWYLDALLVTNYELEFWTDRWIVTRVELNCLTTLVEVEIKLDPELESVYGDWDNFVKRVFQITESEGWAEDTFDAAKHPALQIGNRDTN